MKSLIVCGVIAAAALNSPWLIEGASNNCAAVERVGMRKVQAERASQSNSEQLGASIAMGFFALSEGSRLAWQRNIFRTCRCRWLASSAIGAAERRAESMGWLVCYKPPDVKPVDFIARENRQWWDRHVVKTVSTSQAVFVLCRYTAEHDSFAAMAQIFQPNDKGEIFTIALWLISNRRDDSGLNFARKDMGETSGPTINGPPSLIKLASPLLDGDDNGSKTWARNWRERSLAAAASRAKVRAIKDGTRVKLAEPLRFSDKASLSEFVVQRVSQRRRMIMAFRSTENGRLYRVPQAALASATITPPGG